MFNEFFNSEESHLRGLAEDNNLSFKDLVAPAIMLGAVGLGLFALCCGVFVEEAQESDDEEDSDSSDMELN